MALYCDISVFDIVGLIIMLVGLATFLGGFGSRGWMILETSDGDTEISVGLWTLRNCTTTSACVESPWQDALKNNVFITIKYVECVVLGLYVGASIFHIIYVIYKSRCLAITITICNLVIVLSLISTIVCWMINIPAGFYPSYSLGLLVLSIVFVSISTSFIIRDLKSGNYYVKRVSITPVTGLVSTEAETSFSNPRTSIRGTRTPVRGERMRSDHKRDAWSDVNDSDHTFKQISTSRQSLVIPDESGVRTQRQYRVVKPVFQIPAPRKYGSARYIDDF